MVINGLKFVGVVNTATRNFPMTHTSHKEIINRGDTSGLVGRNTPDSGEYDLMSYV